jgi:hypothetical protein
MNSLSLRRLIIPVLLFSLAMPVSLAQSFKRPPTPSQQKAKSHGKPLRHRKVKGPANVEKVKQQQQEKLSKLKKDYDKYVKENQKRSIAIQTPEVKERMKQNLKNSDASYKAKQKHTATRTKKAGRKYR